MTDETGDTWRRAEDGMSHPKNSASIFASRTMCVSCHPESVEKPRTGGPRRTDETGDTWRWVRESYWPVRTITKNGHVCSRENERTSVLLL